MLARRIRLIPSRLAQCRQDQGIHHKRPLQLVDIRGRGIRLNSLPQNTPLRQPRLLGLTLLWFRQWLQASLMPERGSSPTHLAASHPRPRVMPPTRLRWQLPKGKMWR